MVLKYIGVGDTKIRFCSLCGCAGSVMDDSEAEASDVVIPLGDWMDRCLWPRVQDHWRVGDIVFPGSHNSGSALYRGVGPQWGACQKASVLQQLEMGVRFLDLRVADDVDSAKRLWICHTFRSCLLSNVLDDIQTFLKAHFREFIGIRIEKDAERTLSEQGEQLLNATLKKYFQTQIIDRKSASELTINELLKKDRRVLLCPRNGLSFWVPCVALHPSWSLTRTDDPHQVITRAIQYLNGPHQHIPTEGTFTMLELIVTPSKKLIQRKLFSSLNRLTRSIHEEFLHHDYWKGQQALLQHRRCNVISYDFVNQSVTRRIIQINLSSLEREQL
eukprot:Protomagalhaensia_wolfi_Nauph_80__666@NODE_137_length_3488_cov_155_320673_g66_i1_p1_GENE_NODE_137_length_3488_cov_155_320673_g66_i1NODE_137_length_3488_cov_155_320673_g66_i1_p1_ORF_typecomplete_len331_score33_40PIPLCX/PF00388_19/6_7e12Varsurf_PPLC/PF03490_13/0_0062_NODE_137_length_3488_cov_155_320673_g66_i13641356